LVLILLLGVGIVINQRLIQGSQDIRSDAAGGSSCSQQYPGTICVSITECNRINGIIKGGVTGCNNPNNLCCSPNTCVRKECKKGYGYGSVMCSGDRLYFCGCGGKWSEKGNCPQGTKCNAAANACVNKPTPTPTVCTSGSLGYGKTCSKNSDCRSCYCGDGNICAKKGSDEGCTALGGKCDNKWYGQAGATCQTSGADGRVKANLCLASGSERKSCCVPGLK